MLQCAVPTHSNTHSMFLHMNKRSYWGEYDKIPGRDVNSESLLNTYFPLCSLYIFRCECLVAKQHKRLSVQLEPLLIAMDAKQYK